MIELRWKPVDRASVPIPAHAVEMNVGYHCVLQMRQNIAAVGQPLREGLVYDWSDWQDITVLPVTEHTG